VLDVGPAGWASAPPAALRRESIGHSAARPWARSLVASPVLLAAVACAVAASIWSAVTHSILLYADAQSHLNIARHVTDGLRPGLAQLGSVWLPLPHIFMTPLVVFDWMWHTGAAGALVGGICFVYSAVRIHSLVEELTGSRVGAWCAFAVYVLNLNALYLQSTALTEPVLLAFMVGSVFHLARWLRTRSLKELAVSGVLTFGATLTRYDGWALLAGAVIAVAAWSWSETRDAKETEANVLVYAVIAGYGVVLWLLYNLIIFHDPLYFIQGAYSAQAQQDVLAGFGGLATKGNVARSAATYGWTATDVLGPAVVGATVAGIAALALIRHPGRRRALVVLGVLGAPVIFNVVSLSTGQTVIRVPEMSPGGMWNDRYGVVALPLAAVTLGTIAGRWRAMAPLVLAVAAVSLTLMLTSTPITVRDGRAGESSAARGGPLLAVNYLHRNYRGGEILADDSKASPFMFESGLDLEKFVTVGFEPWWNDALRDPGGAVAWLVTLNGDAVSADMAEHPERFRRFRLVVIDRRPDVVIRLYERE
jgi:hypothetical protein